MKTLENTLIDLSNATTSQIQFEILEVFIEQRCMLDATEGDVEVVRDFRREEYERIGSKYSMSTNSVAQIGALYDYRFKEATKDYSNQDWTDYMNGGGK